MQKQDYRIETDELGEVKIDNRFYWGSSTQRSLEYFKIGTQRMPIQLIKALAIVKQSAAVVNLEFGDISNEIARAIIDATIKILSGTLDDNFPLSVWQTGSGTQTNMNMNEVIAGIANEQLTCIRGGKTPVHPNDHVNLAQSTNDSFSSAMNIATVIAVNEDLLTALINLHAELKAKVKAWDRHIKIGRTHLQDAVPITLGQEFSAYAAQIYYSIQRIENSLKGVCFLAQGATAVGTGLNCKPGFAEKFVDQMTLHTGYQFKTALNKFEAIASHDALVEFSGTLNTVAVSLMKIANDIRLLVSGPRCGFGELNLPENELGSSMMPGKINPTQVEAITMVCTQVMGNNLSVTIAGSNGQLELNAFKPVIIYNILQSVELLSSAVNSFRTHCIVPLEPNLKNLTYWTTQSLILVTALNNHIGYDNATKIARKAQKEDKTIRQATIELKFLSEDEFDQLVILENMV